MVRKRRSCPAFDVQTMVLPRQARDEHTGKAEKREILVLFGFRRGLLLGPQEEAAAAGGDGAKNGIFFECFPYVCPEPVLAKSSFSYINGSKMPCFAGAILYGGADRLPRVPAPFNICVNTTFKSLTGFVRIEAFQRSNERSERGDHPV
jgi:hypothetical protein